MAAKSKAASPGGTIYHAQFTLVGVTPYSQSAPIRSERAKDETHEAHDKRCWREHMTVMPDGHLGLPAMGLKFGLSKACQWIGDKIAGRGQATYRARFESGVMVTEQAFPINVLAADVVGERVFVNADGKRGSGTRVWRIFPTVPPGWRAECSFVVLDGLIDEDRFWMTLETAGKFVGVGRFRPEKGGFYGRFNVENKRWSVFTS